MRHVPTAHEATQPLREEDLRQWPRIDVFRQRLGTTMQKLSVGGSWVDPARGLKLAEYLSLFLFAPINPIRATTPAVCAASQRAGGDREGRGQSGAWGSAPAAT